MLVAGTEPASNAIESWPQTPQEFALVVEKTQHELVQFAAYLMGNRIDAEDVVQDTYVQAFRQRAEKRHVTEVRAYLFRMVRNRCVDLLRTRKRVVDIVDKVVARDDCFASVEARSQEDRMRGLLARVPGEEAEVIQYRVWAGLTFAEIAQTLGIGVPTAKSRFRYGIDKLRRLLRAERFRKGDSHA